MYHPILRGKQYEFLALREVASIINGGKFIHPIIEPVQEKINNISRATEELIKNNIDFTIILNPSVGDLRNKTDLISSKIIEPIKHKCNLGLIIDESTDLDILNNRLIALKLADYPITVILKTDRTQGEYSFSEFIDNFNIDKILVNSHLTRSKSLVTRLKKINNNLVYLNDPFNRQPSNALYGQRTDEFFSEEHVYFKDNGFIGFSDYLTIGEHYMEGGFAPFAVAIHLTYLDTNNSLRIHHFVSESNDDRTDPGGKFLEALDKLIPFVLSKGIQSTAIQEFKLIHEEERFPGLGSVKKLSISHHLQMVNNFFKIQSDK